MGPGRVFLGYAGVRTPQSDEIKTPLFVRAPHAKSATKQVLPDNLLIFNSLQSIERRMVLALALRISIEKRKKFWARAEKSGDKTLQKNGRTF